MSLLTFDQHLPQLGRDVWVAPSATVIGQVRLGDEASVWYGAVLRGDNDAIAIGARTNIQENSVLHVDDGVPLDVGAHVTIGHHVMLHGCTVGDETLIGMRATVLNHARIGRHCIVGAGALVTEGKEFPDGSLIVGVPAKVVRPLTPQEIERLAWSARQYVENARRHRTLVRSMPEAG